jgi:NAD-dependent dihydropyrimidine dehydrogenase PreA subunit
VGVPHPLYGEEVVAFATARPGRTLEEGPILEFCRTLLSPHKAPKRLYQVDELPKGPSGKIQRLKLAGRYRALAAEGDGLPGPDRSGAAAAGPSDSAGRSGAAPAAPADPAARSGADPAGPTDAADPPGPAGPADSAVPGGEAVGRAGGRFSVAIDFQACKGCRYCLALCPASVFDEGSARNARGHAPPLAARPGDCLGCRACFMACPDFCLEIEEI